jgi:3-hydroxybutyryl-CoA dehydrogenase
MQVAVLCTDEQKAELLSKASNTAVSFNFFVESNTAFAEATADIFFDFIHETNSPYKGEKPLLINAIASTLILLPKNAIRINAWNGFIKRPIIELVASPSMKSNAEDIMEKLGWAFQFVSDEVGMIAPRVISMIINEAYFGLEDGISTKEQIDTAMKLGTNYPYGPFEWSTKIGLHYVLTLLQELTKQDARYSPSKLLIQEANGIIT